MSLGHSQKAIHLLIYHAAYAHYPLSTYIDTHRSSNTDSTSEVQSSDLASQLASHPQCGQWPAITLAVVSSSTLLFPRYGCCPPRQVSAFVLRRRTSALTSRGSLSFSRPCCQQEVPDRRRGGRWRLTCPLPAGARPGLLTLIPG